MFESLVSLVEDFEELADGEVTGVCTALTGKLQGAATSACNPEDLCNELIEMGPEAPIACDLVFVGICIENEGQNANPCAWLIDQYTGGNSNVCEQIEEAVGLIPSGH